MQAAIIESPNVYSHAWIYPFSVFEIRLLRCVISWSFREFCFGSCVGDFANGGRSSRDRASYQALTRELRTFAAAGCDTAGRRFDGRRSLGGREVPAAGRPPHPAGRLLGIDIATLFAEQQAAGAAERRRADRYAERIAGVAARIAGQHRRTAAGIPAGGALCDPGPCSGGIPHHGRYAIAGRLARDRTDRNLLRPAAPQGSVLQHAALSGPALSGADRLRRAEGGRAGHGRLSVRRQRVPDRRLLGARCRPTAGRACG